MPTLATKNPAPTVVSDDVDLPPQFPELPDDVLKRFPSLASWEEDTTAWWNRTSNAIQGNNNTVSQAVTKANQDNGDLRVSLDGFVASITTEINIIINEQGAQAKRIVTVSAMAGVSQNIKVQNTPPVGPVLNDIWIDNTNLTTPVTYEWDGAQWAEVTTPITAAGVADERSARVTADGFLEGKYTLTVIAGNVVTGMNITSSTGGGTNVSSVIFRATDFQIYNGVIGKTMFSVSGSDVQLAGVLTVSTSGKVYIGTGTYGNTNTAWYVDSSGKFSLKDKLTWDGTTLTITGAISATTGSIGGWTINSSTLSRNNATLDSAGQLILGTSNDVVYLSATDSTYRVWVGNVTAGSASFSVTKTGLLFSTGATLTGSITFASTNRVVATDNGSFLTWQGPSGANTPGFYSQQSAAGGGFSAYGVGGGSPLLGLYRSGGSYGSPSNLSVNSTVGTIFVEGYLSGAYNEVGRLQWGTIANGNTNYFKIEVSDAASANLQEWVFNYDGKLYFLATNDVFSPNSALYGAPYMADPYSNIYRSTAATIKTDGNFVAAGGIALGGGSSNPLVASSGRLYFQTGGTLRWFISDTTGDFICESSYQIKKGSSDAWTVKLFDGTAAIEFQASGGQIFGRINGGAAILLG